MKTDLIYLEKLIKLMSDSDLTELTLEENEDTIILKKTKEIVQAPAIQNVSVPSQSVVSQISQNEPVKQEKKGIPVLSPMVGTFYKSASPSTKSFVEVGQHVVAGQVVCIIEAMKLMNEIESEVEGNVTEICVEDGQPVEYGQVLMYLN